MSSGFISRALAACLFGMAWFGTGAMADTEPAPPNRLAVRHWQTSDGLPHNGINAVLETKDGYLWFATYAGVARFDGERFRVFNRRTVPELVHDRITAMGEDGAGALWLGSETGDLYRLLGDSLLPVPTPQGWTPTKIVAIAADGGSDLWVLDRNGALLRMRDGRLVPAPFARDGSWIANGLARDGATGSLIALRMGTVSVLAGEQWVPLGLPAELEHTPVQAICAGKDGLWVGTFSGLWRRDRTGWTHPFHRGPWSAGAINALCEWSEGVMAVGTSESGLYLLGPGPARRHFGLGDRVGDNRILGLVASPDGLLWVGTGMSGVCAVQRIDYDLLQLPEAVRGYPVKTVAARRAGGVWVGTEGGGLLWYADGRWKTFGRADGLTHPYVWSVLEDRTGYLWVGTWGGGLFRSTAPGAETFARVPGFADPRESVAAIFEARDGTIWLGTLHGLVRAVDGRFTRFGVEAGLRVPEVRVLTEDRAGHLWFGTAGGGIGQWRDGAIRCFGAPEGLKADFVVALHFDAAGALWIGGTTEGLTRLQDGRFTVVGRGHGLVAGSLASMIEDGAGNLWISSDQGVLRMPLATLQACAAGRAQRVGYDRYGSGNGMEPVELAAGAQPAGCRTASGELWYPARQGVMRIDPAEPRHPAPPPVALVDSFAVDGVRLGPRAPAEAAGPLVVPAGHERFEFRFTAPSFSRPERVLLRYRLVGLDNAWVDAGTERVANYHHLPPGRYTFVAAARDIEGSSGAREARLAFEVLPQWWDRWWIKLLGYAAIAGLMSATVAARQQRKHRRRTLELERQQALERERARIARDIHDDLGASLTRISLLSQSARQECHDADKTSQRMDSIYATAHELTRKMDEVVWAVNPRHDSLESVADYLSRFAEELLGAAAITCRLDVPVSLPNRPLFAESRHQLFLVFKEALRNVITHAHARCVTIAFAVAGETLTVRIEDDGVGLGQGRSRALGGNGIANMAHRMAEVGGCCTVDAAPGRGVRVTITLPLGAPGRRPTLSS